MDLLIVRERPQFSNFGTFGGVVNRVVAWRRNWYCRDELTVNSSIEFCPLLCLGPATVAPKATA